MIKRIAFIFLLLALIAAGAFFYATSQVKQFVEQPLNLTEDTIITIKSGNSANTVLNQMINDKVIQASSFSRLLPKLYPELTQVKAGTYLVPQSSNLEQALTQFVEGKEHQFAITFVEGSRFSEWRVALSNANYLEKKIETLSEAEIAREIGVDRDKLEGLFLAETYHYTLGTSDLDILKRANRKLNSVLAQAWTEKQAKLPLKSPYEALILASIIEKETAIESERERVASVFINRLNKRMRLQTDPTVIYGMGDSYNGNIRKKDLRTPTPYNTYTINGLPPTPIAMAGKASIEAALNPESSRYLYFVASGNGGHVFSKNLTDHNRAVRAYVKQLRSKK